MTSSSHHHLNKRADCNMFYLEPTNNTVVMGHTRNNTSQLTIAAIQPQTLTHTLTHGRATNHSHTDWKKVRVQQILPNLPKV